MLYNYSSSWTKGTKPKGGREKELGRGKGAGMQAIAQAVQCKAAFECGALMLQKNFF